MWDVRVDDLTDPRVRELVALHVGHMRDTSPPGTSFALDLSRLRAPGITVWTAWDGDALGGMAALGVLDGDDLLGEVKSMRTHPAHLRQGVASTLLGHVLDQARERGLDRVVLETGTGPGFGAAVDLYRRAGFRDRGPFGSYRAGPDNQFLELPLR